MIYPALSTSGLAVLDYRHAFMTRPDLFSSLKGAMQDFNLADIERGLRARGSIIFVLADGIPVATRSLDDLAKRIEWQTGRKVDKIERVDTFTTPAAAPVMPTMRERETADDKVRLRELAEQEPPSHDCALRRDILAAREALK